MPAGPLLLQIKLLGRDKTRPGSVYVFLIFFSKKFPPTQFILMTGEREFMPNLNFADCLFRTNVHTGAAINTFISINGVKFRSFCNRIYRTLRQARTAAGAGRAIDLKRHQTSPPFSQCRIYNSKTNSSCQLGKKQEISGR